ncbi:MAG TPA: DNA polymerase, partial [Nocardioidaceae bacterium]
VAFDVSRQTFRTEEYAEYKANRSTSPSEFSGQVSLIKEVLDALRIPYLEKPGFEADDVIGTLATQAVAAGYDVLICSGDRDSFQLVNDRTTVIYPMRGVSEMKRMTPDAVMERYGVPPERYPELAAIVGETSDNLPGVPGVGQGFAAKWLNQYDGLDGVIANAEQITGKKGESLREHLGDVLRNRQLNALVCDLELPKRPADLAVQPWDRDEVHKIFDGLEFRVLRDRLFETLSADEPDIAAGTEIDGTVIGSGQLAGWLAEHASGDTATGVEVQGTWGAGTGNVTSVALAESGGVTAWVDATEIGPDDETVLAAWLGDPERPKVLHDAKGPMLALAARGWPLSGVVADTALSAYLSHPDQRSYDLADLTLRYLHRELKAAAGSTDQLSFDLDGDSELAQESMQKANAVVDLGDALETELATRGGSSLLADVELPLVDVLAKMEQVGIGVDVDHLTSLEAQFAGRVKQAADDAYAVIGKQINLGSPKQLQVVLFDELGMPKTKRTKTGYTTDAEALQGLYEKTEHPFLQHMLIHRDVTRLRQTVEGLLKTVADDAYAVIGKQINLG